MAAKSLYSVHPSIDYTHDHREPQVEDRPHHRRMDRVCEEVRAEDGSRAPRVAQGRAQARDQLCMVDCRTRRGQGRRRGQPEAYLEQAPKYVDEMYAGKRAALRPIYEKLLTMGLGVGCEAKACPGKTMVPLYRERVFAEIKPATNSRIDLGLALGKVTARLPTRVELLKNAKGNRITHRIPIEVIEQVDGFVESG
jgi:Domain of unknown function (DUF5655)